MKFRLKAFGLHLLGSACVLTLLLGGLYFGWYQWPGWYLTGALYITAILSSVDLTLGPLLTLLIANPRKPRRELARDVSVIVAVQLVALLYGMVTLWHGRPLYYSLSADRIELVTASEVPPLEVAFAQKNNPDLAPHWYSRPQWVWAPPPPEQARERLKGEVASVDSEVVIQMPEFFKPWAEGLPELRKQMKKVDQLVWFSRQEHVELKKMMAARGFAPEEPITLFMTGHDRPLLVVLDPQTLQVKALLRVD